MNSGWGSANNGLILFVNDPVPIQVTKTDIPGIKPSS